MRRGKTIRKGAPGLEAAAVAYVVAAVFFWIAVPGVSAQQQGQGSTIVVPGSQGSGESTLELPAVQPKQGGSLTIPPQGSQTGQELILPSRQLRDQPGYAQVTVTVTDPRGRYLTGLRKDDFRLYMDGKQRPIEFFRQDLNTPVSVGILVDTSGSMTTKLRQARTAIAEFVRDLNDRDDIFLLAFSSKPFLLQPFTTNHSLVMRRVFILRAYGQTALFDAIVQGLRYVQHGLYDKKALLVITDGMDNSSRAALALVIQEARRFGVLVYSIGIGNPYAGPTSSFAIGPFVVGPGGSERVDAKTLRTLSEETGAKTYLIRQVGDGATLKAACRHISIELREQYTLGFVAPRSEVAAYRSLRVDVPGRPGVSVRVRKGLEIGGGPAAYAGLPERLTK